MNDYTTYRHGRYYDDLDYVRQFIFSFGSNYALGVRLFPRTVREETIIFYAFLRYVDELVDNPKVSMPGQTHDSVNAFIGQWRQVVHNGPTDNTHAILRSTYWLFKEKNIPFDYLDDFLEAMQQDLTISRYARYADLKQYMWGSASIVGHVMTFIVGYSDDRAFEHAQALGEAMQLANFLRDIDEDYHQRDRIYIPSDDMSVFGVHESMLEDRIMTPELVHCVKHYVERAEDLFTKGISGIRFLKKGRFSILLAARIYRENIRILKKRHYDIFAQPIRVTRWQKILLLVTTLCMYPVWLYTQNNNFRIRFRNKKV